jgi:hypothetical protein
VIFVLSFFLIVELLTKGVKISMSNSVNFVKKGALGRVNSVRLYAFNATLKKEALKEKGYWELNKDAHPINRYWHKSWLARQHQYDPFVEKERAMPVDQKFKILKSARMLNLIYGFPILIVLWILLCYLRYRFFGITTIDDGDSSALLIQSMTRMPKV